nr:proline-rich protein HaeIII subfamily 1-like [Dasypus novemcinctus]
MGPRYASINEAPAELTGVDPLGRGFAERRGVKDEAAPQWGMRKAQRRFQGFQGWASRFQSPEPALRGAGERPGLREGVGVKVDSFTIAEWGRETLRKNNRPTQRLPPPGATRPLVKSRVACPRRDDSAELAWRADPGPWVRWSRSSGRTRACAGRQLSIPRSPAGARALARRGSQKLLFPLLPRSGRRGSRESRQPPPGPAPRFPRRPRPPGPAPRFPRRPRPPGPAPRFPRRPRPPGPAPRFPRRPRPPGHAPRFPRRPRPPRPAAAAAAAAAPGALRPPAGGESPGQAEK